MSQSLKSGLSHGHWVLDDYANIPDPGIPGRTFRALDTGAEYFDTGNEWLMTEDAAGIAASEAAARLTYAPQVKGVVAPILTGVHVTSTVAVGTANRGFFQRCVVPRTGTLHDVSVYNGPAPSPVGNWKVAVFDTGDALAGTYTKLYESGSVAQSGADQWQVVGDPGISVVQGQVILLSAMSSETTKTMGRGASAVSAQVTQLPADFLPVPGGALPKLMGYRTFGSFAYSDTLEANFAVSLLSSVIIIARVV